jgi:hypothetical protein
MEPELLRALQIRSRLPSIWAASFTLLMQASTRFENLGERGHLQAWCLRVTQFDCGFRR